MVSQNQVMPRQEAYGIGYIANKLNGRVRGYNPIDGGIEVSFPLNLYRKFYGSDPSLCFVPRGEFGDVSGFLAMKLPEGFRAYDEREVTKLSKQLVTDVRSHLITRVFKGEDSETLGVADKLKVYLVTPNRNPKGPDKAVYGNTVVLGGANGESAGEYVLGHLRRKVENRKRRSERRFREKESAMLPGDSTDLERLIRELESTIGEEARHS